MKDLKKCPCGKTPKKLFIVSADTADKYAYVSTADCCGEWDVEYRNDYKIGDESYALAVEAWNNAARNNAPSVSLDKLEELIQELNWSQEATKKLDPTSPLLSLVNGIQKLIDEASNG